MKMTRALRVVGEAMSSGGLSLISKPKPALIEEAVALLEDGLFLRMNGERPPGASHNRPEAETWRTWDQQTEDFLRRYRGHRGWGR